MTRWVWIVLLAPPFLVVPVSKSAAAECETIIGGDVASNDSTYGGGGSTDGCSTLADGSTTDVGYDITRTVRPEPLLCPRTPDALQEIIEYRDPVTGVLVDRIVRCIGAIVPGDPAPPPAPSPTEVVERLPLPMPEVHTSPPNQGLVGFETYLWWGAETELPPLSVTVGEWTATVAPVLLDVTWDMGNGDTRTGNGAGTAEHPSARYTYTTHCDCTITVTAIWGGTVTLSHPLLGAPIQQQAAGVPFSQTLAYDVVEREAVIVG